MGVAIATMDLWSGMATNMSDGMNPKATRGASPFEPQQPVLSRFVGCAFLSAEAGTLHGHDTGDGRVGRKRRGRLKTKPTPHCGLG